MAKDQIGDRFEKRKDKGRLGDLAKRKRSTDDLDAEEAALAAAKEERAKDPDKYQLTKGDQQPGRNEPCPCGSGKKYKKCCGKAK